MRKGFLGALGAWLAGAGVALAQPAQEFRPAQGYVYPGAPQVYPPPAAMGQQPTMTYPSYVQQPAMVYQQPIYQQPMYQQPMYSRPMMYQQPMMYQRPMVYSQSMMYPRATANPYAQVNYARPMPLVALTSGQPQTPAVPYLNAGPAVIPSAPAAESTLPTMPAADEGDHTAKAAPAVRSVPLADGPESAAPADLPDASGVMSSAAAPGPACDDKCDKCEKDRAKVKEKKHTFSWPKPKLFGKKEKVEKATPVAEACPDGFCTACGKKCKAGKKFEKCGKKCERCAAGVAPPPPTQCATCNPSYAQGCAVWCPPCPCARAGGVPPCAACGMPCAQYGMAYGGCGAGCGQGCSHGHDDDRPQKHKKRKEEGEGEGEEGCQAHCWFSAEYLQWLVKDDFIASPLLVAGNSALLGNSDLEYDTIRGGRVTAGYRYAPCLAFETSVIGMERGTANQSVNSSPAGLPALSRPQVDASTGVTTLVPVSSLGTFTGGTSLDARTLLYGADTNVVYTVCSSNNFAFNVIGGFRYLHLEERLDVTEVSQSLEVLDELTTRDRYSTKNRFYGGQLGVQVGAQCGCLYAAATGKIAAGVTQERLSENGVTTATTALSTTSTGGGINVRSPLYRDETEFSFVPEGSLEVGFQLSPHVSATFGYTFLYWNKVARPGEQVSNVINNPVTSNRISDSTFWAQAISGGLAFRY